MTQPRPTVERINPEHFRTREKYLLYLRHVFAYEHVIGQIDGPCRVLDVGTGDGYGAAMLANAGHDVTAVDVHAPTVEAAASRHAMQGLRFVTFDGANLPFDDESFDIVVAMQVIEHVEEDIAFATELRRVLTPNGSCWFTTPNRPFRVASDAPVWNPFHVREYWQHTLKAVLAPVFSDVSVMGVAARQDVQDTERRRVERGFRLLSLIPAALRERFAGDVPDRFATELMHVVDEEHAGDAIDLIARCRRAP